MKTKQEKIPDWDGARYWGELVLFTCPNLYGKPVHYTDGTTIPYVIELPKYAKVTAEELASD